MGIYAILNSLGHSYSRLDVNEKLKQAGIPADIIQKGEAAIQAYADENHITLPSSDEIQRTEAKPEEKTVGLKKGGGEKAEFEAKLEALGVPKATIEQGKEAVQKYASAHNIQLPPPPQTGAKLDLVA